MLLADIYSTHKATFENYFTVEKYLNGSDLLNLCKSSNGLFGRGPKPIMDCYYKCLDKAGKEPYYYESKLPHKNETNIKLALLGGTYFIGEEFKFKKV